MKKISNPLTPILDYLSQSIRRMVMVTFVFVLLLPLAFLLPSLNKNIWEEVHQDNLVKHKLLASGLVEPIQLHIETHQKALKSLGKLLQSKRLENTKATQSVLNDFTASTDNVMAVSLLLTESGVVTTGMKSELSRNTSSPNTFDYISAEKKYHKYDKGNSISSVVKSNISSRPVFLITQHLVDNSGEKKGTLIAEIGLGYIKALCGKISFGEKGHCAVVDDKGGIVSHPNSTWVSQIHSFSNEDIVKKLKVGGEGVLEYFSPANNEKMIGGYAKVDKLDWGVMILQPRSEIDLPFNNIAMAILSWVVVGIVTALLIAFFVTKKITRPLNILVTKSKELDVHSESYKLGEVPKSSPSEIRVLWNTISKLIESFQEANAEVKLLSGSLSKDLRKVVGELRENNLRKSRNIDLLTGITSKVCFEDELAKALAIHKGDNVGVILIDIDNYQAILDKNGQEAGNLWIKHVAKILSDNVRSGDMVARYDDADKFIVYLNNSTPESLHGTAEKLRNLVENNPIVSKDDSIYLTLSIGVLSREINEAITVDSLMKGVDESLRNVKSKGNGRGALSPMRAQA